MDNNNKNYDAIESIMRLSRAMRRQPPPHPPAAEMTDGEDKVRHGGPDCRGERGRGFMHGRGPGGGHPHGPGGMGHPGGMMPPPESVRRLMKALSDSIDSSGISSRELAELLDIRPSSLTELLARAEKQGIITRTPDENDKRVVRVKLSEDGAKAIAAAEDQRRAHLEQLTSCFTPEEHKQFCELCDKLCAHIESLSSSGDENEDGAVSCGGHRHGGHGHGFGRGGHCPEGHRPAGHGMRGPGGVGFMPPPPFGEPPFGEPPFDDIPGEDNEDSDE